MALLWYLPGDSAPEEEAGRWQSWTISSAYSRLADSLIERTTKEQLANVARLLALNCGKDASTA